MPEEPAFTAEQVDAAMAALNDPERLRHAQDVVTHAAPGLQRLLDLALEHGGYFEGAQDQAVRQAAGADDLAARIAAIQNLVAEEARVGMLVGAAVGFELARVLHRADEGSGEG